MKLTLEDGSIYEGEIVNGKPHGKGKYTYANGSNQRFAVYEGDWKDGKCSGKGKITYANGDVYEDSFVDGKPHKETPWWEHAYA